MRRLIILAILLFPCLALAAGGVGVKGGVGAKGGAILGGGVAAASCGGVAVQSEITEDASDGIGQADGTQYKGSKITYSGTTGTLCQIDLNLLKTNDPDKTLTVDLYSDNSNEVGTFIATLGSISTTTLTTSGAWYSFTGINQPITNSTSYWIVVHVPTADSNNYAKWSIDGSCAVANLKNDADGVPPYTPYTTSYCGLFKLFIIE